MAGYKYLLCKFMVGILVLILEVFQLCDSAVDSCRTPCNSGEFCYKFFDMCFSCSQYCTGQDYCRQACTPKRNTTSSVTGVVPTKSPTSGLNTSTLSVTDFRPTSTYPAMKSITEMVHLSNDPSVTPREEIYISNDDDKKLSSELILSLFFVMLFLMIMIMLVVKHRKKLKRLASGYCCFVEYATSPPSTNVSRARSLGSDEAPTENEPERRSRTNRYELVQRDECSMETECIDQPRLHTRCLYCMYRWQKEHCKYCSSSKVRSPSRRCDARNLEEARNALHDVHINPCKIHVVPRRVNAGPLFQSAQIRFSELLERDNLQGAIPTDQQTEREKTPEIHRKVTDGTHECHEYTTGASVFTPPDGTHEVFPYNHDSGHGV